MSNHNIPLVSETKSSYFYCCPFHGEKNASFVVDKSDNGSRQRFHCLGGCKASGSGAIALEAMFLGVDPKDRFLDVVKSIAKMFNLTIEGDNKNGWFHRSVEVAPSDEIVFTEKPWDDNALRGLGCEVRQVMMHNRDESVAVYDDDGKPLMRYSWNPAYYEDGGFNAPFDPQELEQTFSLHYVESFITEARESRTEKGKMVSYEVKSTDFYPIYYFFYSDHKGWWAKKYEPLCKPNEQGRSYKNTYWYERGKSRDNELKYKIYGDTMLMDAVERGEVARDEKSAHPTVDVEDDGRIVSKFKRVILCSGPRDGINVYYHSDAHVCWLHSESVDLLPSMYKKLRAVADQLYVLYDIDKTGIKRAEKIALSYLDFNIIYLPDNLSTLRSSRTGKKCKDAEEYLNNYHRLLKKHIYFQGSINSHFQALIHNSHSMQFWERKYATTKTGADEKKGYYKYTMDIDNMAQFLSASGLRRYTDNCDESHFVIVKDNIVEVLPDKEIQLRAIEFMKSYIDSRMYPDAHAMKNAISSSTRLNMETLNEVRSEKLDFRAYGEDFDYFYFSNGAVRITPDEIRLEPYDALPYSVNADAKVNAEWIPSGRKLFDIVRNPDYDRHYQNYLDSLACAKNEADKITLNRTWTQWKKLNAYKLVWHEDMNDLPPVVQWLYDMGRVYWKLEESHRSLTPEQVQFQDMHFINKAGAIGFLLSRFRTQLRQQMVTLTDYSMAVGDVATGRNGKSTIGRQLIPMVRNVFTILGKSFKTRAETMGQNFHDYKYSVHDLVYIDDLKSDIGAETFYNLTSQISVKNLYNNEYLLPLEDSPKIFVSYNKSFDVMSESTLGRMYMMFASDYYHEADIYGNQQKRSPETKFGYDIFAKSTPEDAQLVREMLAQFLQFYLHENRDHGADAIIQPPLDEDSLAVMLQAQYHFPNFVSWAVAFFAQEHHVGFPVARSEMLISLLRYNNQSCTCADVKEKMAIFVKDIDTFCNVYGYNNTPACVISSKEDRKFGYMRASVWTTQSDEMSGEYFFSRPRVRKIVQSYVFYKMDPNADIKVPSSPKAVNAAPEQDLGDLVVAEI